MDKVHVCVSVQISNPKISHSYTLYSLVIGAIQSDPKRTVIIKANTWMAICKNPIINPKMLKSNGPHDLTVGISIVTAAVRLRKENTQKNRFGYITFSKLIL